MDTMGYIAIVVSLQLQERNKPTLQLCVDFSLVWLQTESGILLSKIHSGYEGRQGII